MIFNCKKLAARELEKIKDSAPKNLSVGVLQVGKDPVSEVYVEEKRKAAEKAGIEFTHYKLSSKISFNNLKAKISGLSDDGLIIQLPIKSDLDTQKVLNLIPFGKDIDALSEMSVGKMYTGRLNIFPPVVSAIDKILKDQKIDMEGKILGVVGPGRLVGRPTISYGLNKGASIVSVNENSRNPEKLTAKADILVTGVGKPDLIKAEMVKEGAIVIDAGTSKKDGRVVGDVDLEDVKEKVNLVTPVPGGVGPLTVVCLLENLLKKNVN